MLSLKKSVRKYRKQRILISRLKTHANQRKLWQSKKSKRGFLALRVNVPLLSIRRQEAAFHCRKESRPTSRFINQTSERSRNRNCLLLITVVCLGGVVAIRFGVLPDKLHRLPYASSGNDCTERRNEGSRAVFLELATAPCARLSWNQRETKGKKERGRERWR